MRVAYLSADPGIPVFGTKGASVHVQEIIRAWRALGAQVKVYATRIGENLPEDLADLEVVHVPVPAAPKGHGEDRLHRVAVREQAQQTAAQAMAAQVIADGADAVYERYSLFSTALAEVVDTLSVPGYLEVNAPLIDEQRNHRDLIDEQSAHAALARQVAVASRTACVSEPVAQWVRDTIQQGSTLTDCDLADRVVVTPNGVNVDRILPSTDSQIGLAQQPAAETADAEPMSTPEAASAWPEPGAEGQEPVAQSPVVVFVGTLKPWHGVEHLVQAHAMATSTWRLRLVGDGPQREALEAQAQELGVDVEFIGAVAPDQIPEHLRDCAIAVAPYPLTGASADQYFSPLKIYEYCAAALPVVASRVGQVPQIIDDGVTGLLVAPSDPAALAAAIDRLVRAPRQRRTMGRAAREMAVRDRSWHRVLHSILAGTELESLAGPESTPATRNREQSVTTPETGRG